MTKINKCIYNFLDLFLCFLLLKLKVFDKNTALFYFFKHGMLFSTSSRNIFKLKSETASGTIVESVKSFN